MSMSTGGRVAAIIAEYNPFHNGHAYHLNETRRLTGAQIIVVIMSGNYVQRGECANCDKFTRTRMALAGGADLVLELPLPFACAGVETFARGGVALADALGCVDILGFGMECGDVPALMQAADAVSDDTVKPLLAEKLAEGKSFAAARTEAVRTLYGDDIAALLCLPNNTLAVEYIRALRRIASPIRPLGVTRSGAAHDAVATVGDFASATAVRDMLRQTDEAARRYVPAASWEWLGTATEKGSAPADLKRCERAILSRLRSMTREQMALLPDVSEGLENRLYACTRTADSLEELYAAVKSKRYSHARIRRIVLSAFLGIRASHAQTVPYLRILGMNAQGRALLANAHPKLPMISSYKHVAALSTEAQNLYRLECHADDLWGLMTPSVQPCGVDMTARLIVEC